MYEDVESLRAAVSRGQAFTFRCFWKATVEPDGRLTDACFSQWWRSDFVVDGWTYTTAEQWMMAGKARLFDDPKALKEILTTRDPSRVKQLGKQVRGFDEARWCAHRLDLVTEGNVAKFSQDPRMKEHLVATGDAVLVEASPLDKIWGIGLAEEHLDAYNPARWQGLNLLGFALMRARARVVL